jgi:hypothetical protein
VRNLYSFILFVSLLFPTVVEAFHVLHESHDTFISEGVNINDSKLKCQISLFSNQEDETDFFSQDIYESFIPYINVVSFIESDTPIISYNYHSSRKRGPPAKV